MMFFFDITPPLFESQVFMLALYPPSCILETFSYVSAFYSGLFFIYLDVRVNKLLHYEIIYPIDLQPLQNNSKHFQVKIF